ncbi:hypothetical protein GGR57DRAFT_518744 [Xylariaceae sp. FL1272]|nr:hypothetical protein GGR57DRAFT_518744 [Xylariaceae sp. FL1272]
MPDDNYETLKPVAYEPKPSTRRPKKNESPTNAPSEAAPRRRRQREVTTHYNLIGSQSRSPVKQMTKGKEWEHAAEFEDDVPSVSKMGKQYSPEKDIASPEECGSSLKTYHSPTQDHSPLETYAALEQHHSSKSFASRVKSLQKGTPTYPERHVSLACVPRTGGFDIPDKLPPAPKQYHDNVGQEHTAAYTAHQLSPVLEGSVPEGSVCEVALSEVYVPEGTPFKGSIACPIPVRQQEFVADNSQDDTSLSAADGYMDEEDGDQVVYRELSPILPDLARLATDPTYKGSKRWTRYSPKVGGSGTTVKPGKVHVPGPPVLRLHLPSGEMKPEELEGNSKYELLPGAGKAQASGASLNGIPRGRKEVDKELPSNLEIKRLKRLTFPYNRDTSVGAKLCPGPDRRVHFSVSPVDDNYLPLAAEYATQSKHASPLKPGQTSLSASPQKALSRGEALSFTLRTPHIQGSSNSSLPAPPYLKLYRQNNPDIREHLPIYLEKYSASMQESLASTQESEVKDQVPASNINPSPGQLSPGGHHSPGQHLSQGRHLPGCTSGKSKDTMVLTNAQLVAINAMRGNQAHIYDDPLFANIREQEGNKGVDLKKWQSFCQKIDESVEDEDLQKKLKSDSPRESSVEIPKPKFPHIVPPPGMDLTELEALHAASISHTFPEDSDDDEAETGVGQISPCTFLRLAEGARPWNERENKAKAENTPVQKRMRPDSSAAQAPAADTPTRKSRNEVARQFDVHDGGEISPRYNVTPAPSLRFTPPGVDHMQWQTPTFKEQYRRMAPGVLRQVEQDMYGGTTRVTESESGCDNFSKEEVESATAFLPEVGMTGRQVEDILKENWDFIAHEKEAEKAMYEHNEMQKKYLGKLQVDLAYLTKYMPALQLKRDEVDTAERQRQEHRRERIRHQVLNSVAEARQIADEAMAKHQYERDELRHTVDEISRIEAHIKELCDEAGIRDLDHGLAVLQGEEDPICEIEPQRGYMESPQRPGLSCHQPSPNVQSGEVVAPVTTGLEAVPAQPAPGPQQNISHPPRYSSLFAPVSANPLGLPMTAHIPGGSHPGNPHGPSIGPIFAPDHAHHGLPAGVQPFAPQHVVPVTFLDGANFAEVRTQLGVPIGGIYSTAVPRDGPLFVPLGFGFSYLGEQFRVPSDRQAVYQYGILRSYSSVQANVVADDNSGRDASDDVEQVEDGENDESFANSEGTDTF